jgi:hypothetical protein
MRFINAKKPPNLFILGGYVLLNIYFCSKPAVDSEQALCK